jgi:hypothetical protein
VLTLYSGIELIPKRGNQIFANNKYRIAYNNKKNNDKRKVLAEFNKSQTKIERFDREVDMSSWEITNHSYSYLNRLKRHNLETFHYWFKTLEVL